MPMLMLRPYGWTSEVPAPPGRCGMDTLNMHTARGPRVGMYPDRGYSIARQVAGSIVSKAGSSFVHQHTDGTEYVWFALNTALYQNDGASPSSIGSSIPAMFGPSTVNMGAPCGMSAILAGDETKTQIIRYDGVSGLEAALLEIGTPGITTALSGSGSSWGAGAYNLRVCWIDKDGDTINVFSHPSTVSAETVTGTLEDIVVTEPPSAPTRATHWRIAATGVGATDAPANYLYWKDYAVGSGNQTLTAPPTLNTTQAFTDINGTYRQAEMALDSVDVAILHQGRMFYAATTGADVGWSERNNLNHFYPDQLLSTGAETGWNSPVVGFAEADGGLYVLTSNAIHKIVGDFTRDDQGVSPTYIINAATLTGNVNIGCVSNASIRVVDGLVYFWSTRGPAVLVGGRVRLLASAELRRFLQTQLDWTYAARIVCAEDPDLNTINWIVPRRTNSSRPHDGASVAGICDRMLRWDTVHNVLSMAAVDGLVHVATRKNGSQGSKSVQTFLMAMGQHGSCLRMNYGRSAGGPADVSGTDYDGQTASATTTTTATIALSGISLDDLVGQMVTLSYPTDDTNYPGLVVQKMVETNSATSGGSVIITWSGALTAPTDTEWTVRLAGMICSLDIPFDPHDYAQFDPDDEFDLKNVDLRHHDVVGLESVA